MDIRARWGRALGKCSWTYLPSFYLFQVLCQPPRPAEVKMLVSLEPRREVDSRRWRGHEGDGGPVGIGEEGFVKEKTREKTAEEW